MARRPAAARTTRNKGEGNDAYENFVENLTIDVGAGNPGAIGIDYLANNIGAIRNVRVTAPPGSGAIGISMQRKWPGPALLQRVDVHGFATGIAVANTEYGVTLDHVSLDGQRDIGLVNDGNAVTAADLTIDASATAIANQRAGRADRADEGGAAAERRGCDGPVEQRQRGGTRRDARRICPAGWRRRIVGRRVAGRAVAARSRRRRT